MILTAQLRKVPVAARPGNPTSTPASQHRPEGSDATAVPAALTDIIHEKQHKAGQAQADSAPAASVEQDGQPLAGNAASTGQMHTDYLFHFGDTTEIRKALEMPNRLTG